jgi:hypothetical protein
VSRWTDARLHVGEVLTPDVGGECRFSSSTISNAASRAFAVFAVLDEPHGGMGEPPGTIVLGSPQPEARSFASTRHCPLMRSMFCNVV